MRKIRDLLLENFRPGDYWITLTYRKEDRPEDIKEAAHDAKLFRDRLKKYFKKVETEFKWIQTTEIGSKGGAHHHMVINRIAGLDKYLAKEWAKGKVRIQLLYEDGRFRDLADYLAKEGSGQSARTHSRNLRQPKKVKEIMNGTMKRLRENFKGRILDKDSIVEGVNVFGYAYRIAEYVKLE
jgi:hypothetical protein